MSIPVSKGLPGLQSSGSLMRASAVLAMQDSGFRNITTCIWGLAKTNAGQRDEGTQRVLRDTR